MRLREETRGAGGRTRASECVAWTADTSTNTENLLAVQAARLCRRFKLSHELAAVVAELAFTTKEATR